MKKKTKRNKNIFCGSCGKIHPYDALCINYIRNKHSETEVLYSFYEPCFIVEELKKLKPKEVISMAKVNVKTKRNPIKTHEGGAAKNINAYEMLRRSVCSCLLWENEFYEDGVSITQRIADLVKIVKPEQVADLAIEAREKFKLRHVPLFLTRELARTGYDKTADVLSRVIQRADELSEFMAIYWKEKRQPVSAQVKKGLAKAFVKFNEYQLAKYNRDGAVKLRDVLFISHAKPTNENQAETWRKLVEGVLPVPETWETMLSAGKDKKETFEYLITQKKLGGLAMLRNLRNMEQANVDKNIIYRGLDEMNTSRILPYRFITAARMAPKFEDKIEPVMLKCVEGHEKLKGHTVLLIDVSGSMDSMLSGKSDMRRLEAAYGLAILLREICEEVSIYSFSEKLCLIPSRRGFALADAIDKSQAHSGTPLGQAISAIYANKGSKSNYRGYGYNGYEGQGLTPDRLIVITDEQACDNVPNPVTGTGYMINVASYRNGVGYGAWKHVDGFSEAVIDWIISYENLKNE